jgi:hypothetical protein
VTTRTHLHRGEGSLPSGKSRKIGTNSEERHDDRPAIDPGGKGPQREGTGVENERMRRVRAVRQRECRDGRDREQEPPDRVPGLPLTISLPIVA